MSATRIKTKSFPNVETERLLARLEYLRTNLREIARGERNDKSREDFRTYVREIMNCERELQFRDVPFVPVTDGKHLKCRLDIRVIRPYTRADTVYGKRGS